MILFAGEADPVLPDADDGGDDADLERAAFEHLALLDMRFQISDVASAFVSCARPAGETGFAQRVAHRFAAGAVARGVDIFFGDAADIGAAAEETAEMAFLVAPGRDFDGAMPRGIGIDDAGSLQRIDDAERAIEPSGVVLAFKMGAGQQFRSRPGAGAQHIADAVDVSRQPGVGQLLRKPVQRADMRLGEGRLVHAGLVGADGAERIEIGENAGAVDV